MPLTQWTLDLADGAGASARLGQWLQSQNAADFASASLINNAGVIPPIAPLRQSQPADLALALRVGLEAPMALDEALHPNGAKVCSLAPGVIDTDMQVQLRGATGEDFPDQSKFLHLKAQGLLSSPAQAAEQVLRFLARPDFGREPVADVRG